MLPLTPQLGTICREPPWEVPSAAGTVPPWISPGGEIPTVHLRELSCMGNLIPTFSSEARFELATIRYLT